MACNSSACQSSCYKLGQVEEEEEDSTKATPTTGGGKEALTEINNESKQEILCIKCKTHEPMSVGASGDEGRFCGACFRSNLNGKFRLSVSSHAMITPSDNVLVAFSGGYSSRVALQFVHEMQYRAQKNYDACKDRSLPVFGVGVAFIDEHVGYPKISNQIEKAIEEIKLIVSNLAPPTKELYIVPIERICCSDSMEGRDRLKELLDAVVDTTGKEDLLLHLRMLSLQKVALENGYSRLVLGSCTSRIACHVLASTVKGQGYSLPADIQYVDARWDIPVVLPLHDCLAQELKLLCHLDGLKIVDFHDDLSSGINSLVSSFVKILQQENPSRECTIVRTAGKLTPFHFNKIPEINDSNVPLATRRRQKRFNLMPKESISSESFCPMCYSPLNKSDLTSSIRPADCQSDIFAVACCSSCEFQILPKDPSSMEHFYSLLPQPLIATVKLDKSHNLSLLREKIEDCLLSDCDDED